MSVAIQTTPTRVSGGTIDLTMDDSSDSGFNSDSNSQRVAHQPRTPTGRKQVVIIDLDPVEDEEEDEDAADVPPAEGSTAAQSRALALQKRTEPLTMASLEIRTMSPMRCEKTRIPDIILHHQEQGDYWPSHKNIFKGYIQQMDNSTAPWKFINHVDDEPHPPAHFAFVNHYVYEEKAIAKSSLKINEFVTIPAGCGCPEGHCRPDTCLCRKMHAQFAPAPWKELDIGFAYNSQGLLRNEVLSYPQSAIWECNHNCACRGACKNRIVGRGRQVALQVRKHATKGWGVHAGEALQRGQFVLIYAGELVTQQEAANRSKLYSEVGTTYLFSLDPFHIRYNTVVVPYLRAHPDEDDPGMTGAEYDVLVDKAEEWWEETRGLRSGDDEFSVDAGLWGNFARFFNHSCEPNMTLYSVYTHDRDIRRPFMSFFTNRAVAQGEELTFDYDFETDKDLQVSAKMMDHVAIHQKSGTEQRYLVSKKGPARESSTAREKRTKRLSSGVSEHGGEQADDQVMSLLPTSSPPATPSSEAEEAQVSEKATLTALRCVCGAPTCREMVFRG